MTQTVLLIIDNRYPTAASQSIRQTDVTITSESLVARLRLDPRKDSEFVPLPAPLLRKYIAYARAFVFPK